MVDLTISIIIGAAPVKIVDSVATDLVISVLGTVVGEHDFTSLFLLLGKVFFSATRTLGTLKKRQRSGSRFTATS